MHTNPLGIAIHLVATMHAQYQMLAQPDATRMFLANDLTTAEMFEQIPQATDRLYQALLTELTESQSQVADIQQARDNLIEFNLDPSIPVAAPQVQTLVDEDQATYQRLLTTLQQLNQLTTEAVTVLVDNRYQHRHAEIKTTYNNHVATMMSELGSGHINYGDVSYQAVHAEGRYNLVIKRALPVEISLEISPFFTNDTTISVYPTTPNSEDIYEQIKATVNLVTSEMQKITASNISSDDSLMFLNNLRCDIIMFSVVVLGICKYYTSTGLCTLNTLIGSYTSHI